MEELISIGYLIFKDIISLVSKFEQNNNLKENLMASLGRIQRFVSDELLRYEIGDGE